MLKACTIALLAGATASAAPLQPRDAVLPPLVGAGVTTDLNNTMGSGGIVSDATTPIISPAAPDASGTTVDPIALAMMNAIGTAAYGQAGTQPEGASSSWTPSLPVALVGGSQPTPPFTGSTMVVSSDLDARLMFEVSRISTLVNNNRWSVQDLSAAAYDRINVALGKVSASQQYPQVQGDLELVWGPAFKMTDEPDVPTTVPSNTYLSMALQMSNYQEAGMNATALNTMYVARDRATATYYVGIAGTNSISVPNWILEDFQVGALATPWANPSSVPAGAQVFAGTALGLSFLQEITPLAGMPGAGQSIAQFLQSERDSQQSGGGISAVRVSGHSLGGALSPVLALWLQDEVLPTTVNVTANIYAGATPGNAAFQQYYNSRPLAQYTQVVDNSLDMVPHAWGADTLAAIPSLYEANIPGSADCVGPLVTFATNYILAPNAGVGMPINPQADPEFALGFNTAVVPMPPPSMLSTVLSIAYGGDEQKTATCTPIVSAFMSQASWQHTGAYKTYLAPVSV